MDNIEEISGRQRITLFQQLSKDRVLLNMRLLGMDYERLTMVTDVQSRKGDPYFLIDCPRGFKEVLTDTQSPKMRFEFTGRDRLYYMFRATGAEIIGQEVRIAFPAVIERLQRRTAYRLDAPLGTKMRLTLDGREFEMTVINISEGGALVTMQKAMEMTPVFQGGERVKHVLVRFPSDHPSLRVSIREAVVKRVEKDAESARVRYALSFTEIRMPEKQALSKIIYGLQREYLRKRQFMEA